MQFSYYITIPLVSGSCIFRYHAPTTAAAISHLTLQVFFACACVNVDKTCSEWCIFVYCTSVCKGRCKTFKHVLQSFLKGGPLTNSVLTVFHCFDLWNEDLARLQRAKDSQSSLNVYKHPTFTIATKARMHIHV